MEDFEKKAEEFEQHLHDLGWERVTHCGNCENHRDRAGMCDIWHCHTGMDGYCHRSIPRKK